jgi:ribose 5-phosphate isomerase B
MKIYFATDHAGFALKEKLISFVRDLGYEVEDCGAKSFNIGDDFTDFVSVAAKAVSSDSVNNRAIIFGGSGQGEAMLANRYKNVRATVFYGEPRKSLFKKYKDDIIALSRSHNDANVLSIGARFVNEKVAKEEIERWLKLPFSNEERHRRRIEKIEELSK